MVIFILFCHACVSEQILFGLIKSISLHLSRLERANSLSCIVVRIHEATLAPASNYLIAIERPLILIDLCFSSAVDHAICKRERTWIHGKKRCCMISCQEIWGALIICRIALIVSWVSGRHATDYFITFIKILFSASGLTERAQVVVSGGRRAGGILAWAGPADRHTCMACMHFEAWSMYSR